MKRFFYLCAALLCLSLAFHFGYTTARAQAPSNPAVGIMSVNVGGSLYYTALTANGDVYSTGQQGVTSWSLVANIFSGGPTPALHQSWGQLKSRYATPPATPGMTATPGADSR
jgi:hypothetical protein